MAAHGLWKTTDLSPLLAERGVKLSYTQVYRLVNEKPERLSLHTMAALCDVFDCTPADLVEPYLEGAAAKKTAGAPSKVTPIHESLKPERARIVDPE
jgi:DNA-binding Xre family transcriptional regulator